MTLGPLHGPGRRPGPEPNLATGGRRFVLPTAQDTHELGRQLATVLRAGDLLVLGGPLGAGKTALVQGIGAGLGVQGRVASPTFVIARVHDAGRPDGLGLVHVDAYRLGALGEVEDLDLDVDAGRTVTAVEWGAGLVERLADAHLLIELSRAADSEQRTALVIPHGGDWAQRLQDLRDPRELG